jgi:hypothetical protein
MAIQKLDIRFSYNFILLVLHLILYEVPVCDFHHIDGDLLLVPWRSLAWGSLTSPWLDDCACCLVVFSHVLALLIATWLHSWMVVEHTISLWCCLVYMLILDMDDGSSAPRG